MSTQEPANEISEDNQCAEMIVRFCRKRITELEKIKEAKKQRHNEVRRQFVSAPASEDARYLDEMEMTQSSRFRYGLEQRAIRNFVEDLEAAIENPVPADNSPLNQFNAVYQTFKTKLSLDAAPAMGGVFIHLVNEINKNASETHQISEEEQIIRVSKVKDMTSQFLYNIRNRKLPVRYGTIDFTRWETMFHQNHMESLGILLLHCFYQIPLDDETRRALQTCFSDSFHHYQQWAENHKRSKELEEYRILADVVKMRMAHLSENESKRPIQTNGTADEASTGTTNSPIIGTLWLDVKTAFEYLKKSEQFKVYSFLSACARLQQKRQINEKVVRNRITRESIVHISEEAPITKVGSAKRTHKNMHTLPKTTLAIQS
ncbi:hypothetical protein GCK72_023482 [Caenorhabditis remanei]|uniref:Uncharacterized protein n=1 Tax=Caenorhabditis remanei TaxID=31234 RepID=A0A6A5FX15_CAERE|nr:hypothetical protein GCK72_023482 [Caenorhabditis remanei]KAF1747024.1 hypothetical protein GCK72_023482 [Caenorhabditis remanei]